MRSFRPTGSNWGGGERLSVCFNPRTSAEKGQLFRRGVPAHAEPQALGLSSHPAIAATRRQYAQHKHPMYGKVIYHADAATIYRNDLPDCEDEGGVGDPIVVALTQHAGGADGHGVASRGSGVGASSSSGSTSAPQAPTASSGGVGASALAARRDGGEDGNGGGGATKPKASVLTRHHAALPMIRKYLVSYLVMRLRSDAGGERRYFSVKFDTTSVMTMGSMMKHRHVRAIGAGAAEQVDSPDHLGVPSEMVRVSEAGMNAEQVAKAVAFSKIVGGAMFCRLVRVSPHKLIVRGSRYVRLRMSLSLSTRPGV